MNEVKITFEELMNELEVLRTKRSTAKEITDEQKQFLLVGRDKMNPVSFEKLARLWSKRWGKVSRSKIERMVKELLEE